MRVLWKIMKVFGNIFGIFLSIILCLVLAAMLIVTPLVSGFSELTRPETITTVIHEIDFGQMIRDNISDDLSAEEQKGIDILVDMTQSQAFYDLVELYATDLSNVFEEEEKPSVITEESLRQVMEDNMDELVDIVREASVELGEDVSSYTDEELEQEVREFFDRVVDKFIELAPTADDLRALIIRLAREFSSDSSPADYTPNSGMESADVSNDGWQTQVGGSDGDSVVSIVITGDGDSFQDSDGNVYYLTTDPETGATVIKGEGDLQSDNQFVIVSPKEGTASGGTISFGKSVAVGKGKLMLLTSVSPSGNGQADDEHLEKIAHNIMTLGIMAKNGTLTTICVVICILLALLICLFRWPRFKGFMWVAITLLSGATLSALLAVVLKILHAMNLHRFVDNTSMTNVISNVIGVVTENMFIDAAICVGIAVGLIVMFGLFRTLLEKQQKAKVITEQKTIVVLPGVTDIPVPVPSAELEDVLAEIQNASAEANEDAVTEKEEPEGE